MRVTDWVTELLTEWALALTLLMWPWWVKIPIEDFTDATLTTLMTMMTMVTMTIMMMTMMSTFSENVFSENVFSGSVFSENVLFFFQKEIFCPLIKEEDKLSDLFQAWKWIKIFPFLVKELFSSSRKLVAISRGQKNLHETCVEWAQIHNTTRWVHHNVAIFSSE